MKKLIHSIGQAASIALGYIFNIVGSVTRQRNEALALPTALAQTTQLGETAAISVPTVVSPVLIPEVSILPEVTAKTSALGQPVKVKSRMKFSELCRRYFEIHERIARTANTNTKFKKLSTLRNEQGHMDPWLHLFGDCFADELDEKSLAQYRLFRQMTPWSRQYYNKDGSPGKVVEKIATGATIDHSVITAGNVFKFAVQVGWLDHVAFPRVKGAQRLSTGAKERALLSVQHVMAILDEAVAPVPAGIPALMGENAPRRRKQLRNYLAFLAFSGARRTEATMLRWIDIEWPDRYLDGELKGQFKRDAKGQPLCGRVHFRAEIQKKGMGNTPDPRWVEFNDELEALLVQMDQEREPNAVYLFPALPGDNRKRTNKLKKLVQRKPYQTRFDTGFANVLGRLKVVSRDGTTMVSLAEYYEQEITLHHLRVFFISEAIMSKVDIVTIAAWVGHKSLEMIEKIYARLALEHRAAQARQLGFRPRTTDKPGSRRQEPGAEPPSAK